MNEIIIIIGQLSVINVDLMCIHYFIWIEFPINNSNSIAIDSISFCSFIILISEVNGVRQTDSMSNLSDMSGNTAIQTNKPRMDVACVIDTVHTENIAHRKCAFDELKQACSLINANLHQIQVLSKFKVFFLDLNKKKRIIFSFFFSSIVCSLKN